MTFELLDLILFPAIVQGFFIAFLLMTKKAKSKKLNRLLAAFMLSSAFMLIGRMVYARFPDDWLFQIALIPDTIIFIFGPLTYLFTHQLLTGKNAKRALLHFLPALVYLLIVAYFFTIGSNHFNELLASREIWVFFYYVESAGLLSNIFYTVLSVNIFYKYRIQEKGSLSYQQPAVAFLKTFMVVLIICVILWLSNFISTYHFKIVIPFISYNVIWFSMPFVSYVIGYYMLTEPQLFKLQVNLPKTAKLRVGNNDIEALKRKLSNAMAEQRLYENDSLTLKQLAEAIGSTPNNISWILNEVYKQSFYDFVNENRIKAFLIKIEHEEHFQKTILSLAMEVGFRSKSTFNKAFKLIHEMTPSAYIKEHYSNAQKLQYSA